MNDHQNIETPWERLKTKRFRWQPLVPTPKSCRFGRRYFVSPLAPAVLGKYSQNESKEVERPKNLRDSGPKLSFSASFGQTSAAFFDFRSGNREEKKHFDADLWLLVWGGKQTPCFYRPKRRSMANLNVLNGSVKFLSRPRLASSHSWLKGLPADKKAKPSKTGALFQNFS